MKRIFKQWTAGLLAAVMVFALLPAAALAEETGGTAGQTAVEQVQALIDALPDAESITADDRADVEAQLSAIDEAKLALGDEELDALDTARYLAAVEAILALDDMAGANGPMPIDVPAFDGGDGDEGSPYEIATREQLEAFRDYINSDSGHGAGQYFRLTADIDLGEEEWTPIGGFRSNFAGSFDGDGHFLIINCDLNWQGLFGYVGEAGKIANLGVEGSVSTNGGSAGGIAGNNEGTIENCYFVGNLTGLGSQQYGGIAGFNGGTISNCYNAGTISSNGSSALYFGGITGSNRGTIQNCYNIGAVSGKFSGGISGMCDGLLGDDPIIQNCFNTGEISGDSAGGIVGYVLGSAAIESCYYLDTCGAGGQGESKTADNFKALAETLNGSGSSVWEDDPFLGRPVLTANKEPWPISGSGTERDPYLIPDVDTLEKVRDYINNSTDGGAEKYFALTADIDLGGAGNLWTPIGWNGRGDISFCGTFDGGDFTVSGLYINDSPSTPSHLKGLFGYIGKGGTVKNLTVEGEVTGSFYTGGIVGRCAGSLENCHNAANINGATNAGGIAGAVEDGASVRNSSNTGKVTGNSYVGGVVGHISGESAISNCSNSGEVTSIINIGGIAGGAEDDGATVENCSNTGDITGTGTNIGGIMGLNSGRIVEGCYNTGRVSGLTNVGGIVGTNSGTVKGSYNTGEISGMVYIGGVAGSSIAGTTENCYNTGAVAGTVVDCVGGVAGSGVCTNCYYLDTCGADGEGTEITAAEFRFLASALGEGWADSVDGRPVLLSNQETDAIDADVPYEISDVDTLKAFRDYINGSSDGGEGKTFQLTDDIDLAGSESGQWTPIGDGVDTIFMGTFDGGGHRISGLYIKSTNDPGAQVLQGLFGENGGTIRGLDVSGTLISAGEQLVAGMIVGMNMGTVTGCGSEGSVTAESGAASEVMGGAAGGIVGQNLGTVADCDSTAHIAFTADGGDVEDGLCGAGGIVGMTQDFEFTQTVIENCSFSGDVTGTISGGAEAEIMFGIGGIVGLNLSVNEKTTIVEGCSNSGSVTATVHGGIAEGMGSGTGGIVGFNLAADGDSRVKNCMNTGTVSNNVDGRGSGSAIGTGGIVGANLSTDAENAAVENCCNTGTVTGTGDAVLGAVVGINSVEMSLDGYPMILSGKVTNCYYLAANATPGIGGDGGDGATEKTAEQFASGEVAWLLQAGQDTLAWGQTLPSDTCPVPTGDEGQRVWKVTFVTDETPAGAPYAVKYANPTGLAELPAAPEKEGNTFAGWSTEQGGSVDFDGMQVGADTTVYAIFKEIPGIDAPLHGQVTLGGNPAGGAGVTLKQGGKTVASAKTDPNGYYFFADAAPGVYEAVVQTEGRIMTSMVTVDETGTERNLALPAENVSSVLDTQKAPDSVIAVDGLDGVARENGESGSAVTVTMTVERETASTAPNAREIRAAAEGRHLDYLEIALEKTTEATGSTPATEPLTETGRPLTVILRFDFTGKSNVVVYRYHNGSVDTLTETPNTSGESIELDEAGGTITLHVKHFSTYAIGYTQEGETPAPASSFYYNVTVPSGLEGGTVTASRTSAQQGNRITLTAKPNEGYHFASLTVSGRNGKPVELTDNGGGIYTFIMPYGKVTVEAEFTKCGSLSFTDLDAGAWYHDYTDYVIAHGLMQGTGGGLFAPDGAVDRAQMVTVLWNMSGKPVVNYSMAYSDVSEEAWCAEAIRWAASEGIASGYGNGGFGPDDPITREQMAVMIYRYEQKYGGGGFTGEWMYRLPFTDLDQISDWAFEAVAWCNMKGVMSGKADNIFDPKGIAERSEMAAILTRCCGGEAGGE